jgi:predicted GNAT family acetyltransferase
MPDIKLPKGFKLDEEVKPPKGFTLDEKKNETLQSVAPTGTQTSKRGFEPFLPQVPTKTPSVLLSDEQKQQREKQRIGERFETTLLNVPTEFGKVDQFMRSAKKVKDTLPQTPTIKPSTGGMVVIPQGEKIGDSLRKGDTLQDEFTDKLTGKKTGLQKQIENAENAFRAYQGDEIANQAQGYVPPEETLKIKQELGFGEKMSNAGSNFVNKLERFVPNTALALGQTLTTLLGEDYGSDAYRMITASGNADIHRMEAFDKLAKLDAEYKYSKGLIQSVQDLDLGGVAAAVTDAVGSLISTVVTSAPTAGLGLYADMVGSGLYDYNSTKANRLGITVEQLYDSGQNDFFVPAILGGVGAQLEKIGLKGIKQGILSNIKSKAGQKAGLIFHNSNKEGFTEWTQSGLEAYSNSLAQGKNAIQAGEEAVKEMFSKKGAESYLMGAVAAGAAIGGGRILRGIVSSREKKKAADALQKIEQQQQELSNPDISEESRVFIFDNIKNNVKEVVDAVYADVDESENLGENQKKEVFELNKTIQALEIVANDPAVSEETKASAQTRIDELKSKVDDIIATPEIKLAKPTFDTEEQLVKEIRAAEKEFNETGDSAEYQLKINDLNTRLENLVPAPKDAEIGKPEEIDTPRKVIYVQKSFPDKGNEDLTERQIGSVEKAIDAGIKAGKTGNEIYGILNALGFVPANIAGLQENLREYLNNRAEGKDNRTFQETQTQPKQDAIQVETAGQVPVLTEAPVGEEVEQGKPQPKDKVVTEEGKEVVKIGKVGNTEYEVKSDDVYYQGKKLDNPKNKTHSQLIEADIEKRRQEEFIKRAKQVSKSAKNIIESVENGKSQVFTNVLDAAKDVLSNLQAPIGNKSYFEYLQEQVNAKYDAELAALEEPKSEATPETEAKVEEVKTVPAIPKKETKASSVGGDVESTAKALEEKYGIILDLTENKNGDLSIGRIIVPKENRGKGVGKKAMQDIVDYADNNGRRILLTPSIDFGATSVARLKEFYKEFGFIENKGKNKDFTTKDSMYRNPQLTQEQKPTQQLKAEKPIVSEEAVSENIEQTPAQEVKRLRAKEQAELKAAIPNADQYLTDGKVDRDKITDAKDLKKFDEIYDKYDELITPKLKEVKAGSVVGGDVEVVPLETVGEDIVYRGIDKRGFGGNGGGVAGLGKGLYTTNSKEEAQKYAWEDGRTKGKPVALKNAKPINSLVLNDGNVQKWIDENLPKSKYKNESDFRDNLSEYVTGLGYDGITIKSSDGVEIYVKYTEQSLKETKAEEVKSEVAIPKSFTSEGDNKVVDNEGNPLVVYHGTQSNFKDFEIPSNFGKVGYATSGGFEMGMAGGAIYFSSNEDTAKSYSSLDKRKKGRVIKSFIDIKKPYIIDAKGGNWTGRIADEYKIGLKNKDYDGVIVKNVIDSAATGGVVGDVYAVKSPSQIIQIAEPTPAKTDILPKYKKKSIAEWFNKGLNATSIFEGGEIHPEDATQRAAWRSMGGSEFIKLLGGEEIGGETKKGGYFGDNPAIASAQKGEGKYLVEFGGKRVEFETTVVKVSSKDITGVWKYENGSWNKLSKEAVEDLIPKAQTEKEPKAETAPAKPKATKLKAKVDTRLKFKEVSDLSTKINEAVKGSAKRKRLIADRNLLLEKFPIIKYVYENIQNITKQLIQKGIITKDKDKVTYNGVNYSSDEFSSLLHDGLLDQLVKDKIIDDSNFVKKAEAIERTEFDSEEEAELYGISRETDPNVIAAKYFTLPTLEESSSPKDLILMEHFSGKRSSKINESDWAEYNDLNNLTPEIRKKYINSTNKSGRLDTEALSYEENEGISFAPEDFIDFILDYGGAKGFKSKKVSNIQQALLERYFDLTGRKQITDAAAKKAFETISEENKIAEKRYTQKQRLEEAGITEEDIAKEQEFAKEGFGELETPLEKFEYQKKQISKKGKTELEINKEIFAKAKEMAAAIRGAKIDGKGKAFDATLGLPVAIWNGAIETVASAIEAGVAVADAIKRGLNYIQKNNRGQWNKKAYNDRVIAELGLRGIEVNGEDLIVQPLEDKATVELVNGFYSPLEKGIAEAKTDKATGKGWMKVLSGVTEADELNYTGVKDFLNSNADRPISRKELLDYMKDNRIEVVEVVLGVAKGADILNEEQLKRLDELEKLDAKYPSGAIEDIEAGSYDEFLYLLNVRDKSSSEDLIRLQRDSERKAQLAQRSGDKKLAEKYWNDSHRYTARHEALELSEEGAGGISNPTKFSQYQLEGEKENYKELLVTLPKRLPSDSEKISNEKAVSKYNTIVNEENAFLEKLGGMMPTTEQRQVFEDIKKRKEDAKNQLPKDAQIVNNGFADIGEKLYKRDDFKSSHFDEPNILVHLRMNTRTDAEGNKVLFIEEVQSDWGQKGKKEGFNIPVKIEIIEVKNNRILSKDGKVLLNTFSDSEIQDWQLERASKESGIPKENLKKDKSISYKAIADGKKVAGNHLTKEDARKNAIEDASKIGKSTIPTAPFVTDTNAWTKLGLKTALKEAVAQGADKLAWTTGEQQNDRYDLSKTVDYIQHEDGFGGTKYVDISTPNGLITFQVDKKGKILENKNQQVPGSVGKNLADVIGKDITDRILTATKGGRLEGEGLKVGGKGMKGFYGSPTEGSLGIVGNVAEKLFGQKVGTVEIENKKGKIRKASWGDGEVYELVDENGNVIGNYGDKDAAMKAVSTSTQYSIDITPELKQAVKEGIPLFKNELTQAKEKLKEASAALSKLNKNLGIYSDPEQNARALFEYHKALVGVAKAYIKEIVKSGLANIKLDIKDFAEEIGENITQEVKDAWNEANGKGKKTLSDFKEEAEKLQAKEEKERLRQEDLGLVTPKLEDYESEEPIKVSNDFESLAYQAIESKEFRNTLSNKERESGRQLTRAEKRYQANPFMDSFELGERIVAKAKEELGDTYVNDLLSYIAKNQNTLGVDKVSLIMLTLENDLNRQLQEDPDNLTLKKQENMVQNLAISYLRSAARAIGYGKLRRIARVGYDVDEVTSQLFSSGQEESRRKVVKAMQSTADEINDEAELQDKSKELKAN